MKHRRTSIRLKGWDYSEPGAYFVTICTHARTRQFGRVVDGGYEHIIRNTIMAHGRAPLHAIRRYIIDNPQRWHLNRYNPDATGPDPPARALWRMLRADAQARTRRGKT